MEQSSPREVTQLLRAWRGSEESALDRLVPLVYDELRRLAHRYMLRESPGHVLQTTALVNEAYLQLADARQVNWHDRAHVFAISSKLMRQILVHYARSKDARKRGGGFRQVALDERSILAPKPDADLLQLDDALTALAEIDPRQGVGGGTALFLRAEP